MRILVLFGGESVEHEISVITANQIMNALGVNYTVLPLYISKENKLYYSEEFKNLDTFKNINKYLKKKNEVEICKKNKSFYLKFNGFKKNKYFDIAFPIVHGKGVEDGTLLAYLKFKKIPVIADSLSFYSLAQNKTLTKRVLNDLGINNARFCELCKGDNLNDIKYLNFPLIVKPNTLGSSIGIKKANNKEEMMEIIEECFKYDKKILIEEFLENSKEYNISVVEKDGKIITSSIEEVVKTNDLFDYKQKYEGGDKISGMASSKREFPASITKDLQKEIEETAAKIYKYFEAKGVIRIDFLYKDKLYVNEINSIPGSYSFYLWKDKLDFVELLDTVIESSKRDYFYDNKLIKVIDKMNIFDKYKNNTNKLK